MDGDGWIDRRKWIEKEMEMQVKKLITTAVGERKGDEDKGREM